MIANLLTVAYLSFYLPHQQSCQKFHHQMRLLSIHSLFGEKTNHYISSAKVSQVVQTAFHAVVLFLHKTASSPHPCWLFRSSLYETDSQQSAALAFQFLLKGVML